MCVTDPHDMTLAVKVAFNLNTTNQPINQPSGLESLSVFFSGKFCS